jgi:HEAT repeat protein
MPIGPPNGPPRPSPAGIPACGKPRGITAWHLRAGRVGAADAQQQLDRLILDRSQPAIARASALRLLAPYASPASEPAIKAALGDPDPLVRAAAPRALPGIPPPSFVYTTAPLLSDPLRAVRIAAARALAGTDLLALTPEQQTALVKATAER